MSLADRLLAFAATVAAVAALAHLSLGQRAAPAAPGEAYCAPPCDLYQVVWVGDILLGASAQPLLARHGYTWPFAHVRTLIEGDYLIGNAEGPITARRQRHFPDQRWHYNAQPEAAQALADVGFDALSLANNHALDRGPDGLRDSLEHIRAAGMRPFGAGMDADEATAPLLVETPFGRLAVLGFSERWTHGAVAGPGQPGTALFSDEEIGRQRAAAAAAGARWVVAYVHWGENYGAVTDAQRRVAASFARAGYDLVVGHHPHVVQEVDLIDGMPVAYSLGNFVFGSSGRFTDQFPGYGLVARTYFGPDGLRAIELACIVTDNEVVNHQPRPCTSEQAAAVHRRLGPHVTPRNGRGLLEMRPAGPSVARPGAAAPTASAPAGS